MPTATSRRPVGAGMGKRDEAPPPFSTGSFESARTAPRRRRAGNVSDMGPDAGNAAERAVAWSRAQPLPQPWRRAEGTNPDDVLFVHPPSGTSTFEHPMEDALSELRTATNGALHLGEFRGQAEFTRHIEQQIEDWQCQLKIQSGSDAPAGPGISQVAKLELKIRGLSRLLEDSASLKAVFPATSSTYPTQDDDEERYMYDEDPMLPSFPRRVVLSVSFLVVCATLSCWLLYHAPADLAADVRKLLKNHNKDASSTALRQTWATEQVRRNQSFLIPHLKDGRVPDSIDKGNLSLRSSRNRTSNFSDSWGAAALPSVPLLKLAGERHIGSYEDRNHLIGMHGAPRAVILSRNTNAGRAIGRDGEDGVIWEVQVKIEKQLHNIGHVGDEISIDFSPKGGPQHLKGTVTENGISFADGNTWIKLNLLEGINNKECKRKCIDNIENKRSSMKALWNLGAMFEKIKSPMNCVKQCDVLYPQY